MASCFGKIDLWGRNDTLSHFTVSGNHEAFTALPFGEVSAVKIANDTFLRVKETDKVRGDHKNDWNFEHTQFSNESSICVGVDRF